MALPEVGSASYPTPKEIHNTLLSAILYAYDQDGLVANVKKDSEHWKRTKVYADRLSIAIANNRIALSDFSPLSATGDSLTTLAEQFGVTKRPDSPSAGPGTISVSGGGSVTIPEGFVCIAPNGSSYAMVTAQTLSTGGLVNLISVETGAETTQAAGTVMTWADASIGTLGQKVIVGVKDGSNNTYSGDISGGEDGDDEEDLRRRLLERLAFPGVGGNWSYVSDVAEDSSASVEKAYPYNAVRGPASYDVALTKAGGDRTLSQTIVDQAAAGILALLPGHASLNVTSVDPEPVDIVINLRLPLPVNAGGAGSGWRDAVPWPNTSNAETPTSDGAATLTFASATGTITTTGNPWVLRGFLVGMTVVVSGSVSNNGTYLVVGSTGTSLQVIPGLTNETLVAAPAGAVASATPVPVRVVYKTANQVGVTSTTSSPPYVGARFGIWDPGTQEMREFTAAAVGGSGGFYLVTVDNASSDSLSFIGADGNVYGGYYVSAGAFNLSAYATKFLDSVNDLGPGEKTDNANILPRGRRQPSVDIEHPSDLTTLQLGQLAAEHSEIMDATYGARLGSGTATTRTAPSLPTTTSDPPRIITIGSLAFRKS